MSGLVSWGELDAAGDQTTGALIARSTSASGRAVDDRITALGPTLVGYTPEVIGAAEAAVGAAVAGLQLMPKTQGIVTDTVDLDDLRELANVGPFSIRAQYLEHGPDTADWDDNPIVTVEVLRNGPNAVAQRLSWGSSQAVRTARTNTTWFEWQTVVTEVELAAQRPTVTSDLMVTPVGDAQMLLLLDSSRAATDFLYGAEGFTKKDGSGSWGPVAQGQSPSGQALRYQGTDRSVIAWDEYGSGVGDVRVTARVLQSMSTVRLLTVAARIDSDAQNFVQAGIALFSGDPQVYVAEWVGGVYTRKANSVAIPGLPTSGQATFRLALEVEGEFMRAKAWMDGTPEPSEWMCEASTTVLTAGRVGLQQGQSPLAPQCLYLEAETL